MAEAPEPPTPPAPPDSDPKPSDIKSQILQLTLAEIKSSDSDENPCVICLETVTSPATALPCAHSNFDFLCLVSWLQQQPFCPLCKAGVPEVRYTDTNSRKESTYSIPRADKQAQEHHESRVPNPTAGSTRLRRRNNRRPETRRRSDSHVDQALERRRYIYRHNLYSLHIGSSPHTPYSPSIPPPEILSSTPHLLSKARLFLRRELQVFFPPSTPVPSSSQNREFLLEYIIAILKTVDLQSESGAAHAYSLLKDYIVLPEDGQDRTSLFLHELKNWMRWRGEPAGNVSLESWDHGVQYPSLDEDKNKRRYDNEDNDNDPREERGYSWQDETGDHWRPGRSHRGHDPRRNNRTKAYEAENRREE